MIHFFVIFLLMLLSGSIFILGFFTITRGKIIILPNGEEQEEKEIFGDWQLFWERVYYKKIYYEGEQLRFKLKILEQVRPVYVGFVEISREKKSLIFANKLEPYEIRDIEFALNCNVLYNDVAMFLYNEEPVYVFSEWVRKITNCYVCLSGWMGTIYYFTVLHFFPDFIVGTTQKIVFWVIFCISLSFVNKSIKEYFDNSQK